MVRISPKIWREQTMGLAEEIRRAREKIGKSKNAVAELVGVSATYWDKIETGESVPTLDVVARIEKALNMPTGALTKSVGDEALMPKELDVAIEYAVNNLFGSLPYNADSLIEFGKKLKYREKRAFLQSLKEVVEEPVEETVNRRAAVADKRKSFNADQDYLPWGLRLI